MATGRVPTTANSPLTAKGDLFGYSTTQARVAVGNNGETLVADSSTSTGLRYTSGTVQANPILNSAFQVWQRGTSIVPTTTAYSADRWQAYRSVAGSTVSRQATGDTTNLPNIQYCARVQRDSGNTSTATIYLAQTLETVNSIPFAGKTVTFSFYARKGANFSDANHLLVTLQQAATTDANVLTSMPSSTVVNVEATLTTTWQRFTGTATVLSTTTQLGLYAEFIPVGTAGAADYFEITGVQLDIGSVALPFRTYAGTIQGELAACQRYYQRFTDGGGSVTNYANGIAQSSTAAYFILNLLTSMRTRPTTLDISSIRATDYVGGFTPSGAFSIYTAGSSADKVTIGASTFTGLTQYRAYAIESAGSTSAFIGIGAEL